MLRNLINSLKSRLFGAEAKKSPKLFVSYQYSIVNRSTFDIKNLYGRKILEDVSEPQDEHDIEELEKKIRNFQFVTAPLEVTTVKLLAFKELN